MWRDVLNTNVGFLAGGVAFNILLAGVPFVLMLAALLGYVLGESPETATHTVQAVIDRLLPTASVGGSLLDPVLQDVERTRAVFGIGGAVGFFWFSARLFGSLRSVIKSVFSHDNDRTVIHGILWDLSLTLITVFLLVVWVGLTSFLTVSTGRIGVVLTDIGVRQEVMGGLGLFIGSVIAFAVVIATFAALYRWLPKKKTPWIPTLAGATAAAILFEFARWAFAIFLANFPPASVYSGTLGALVIVVFWTYYAALIFVIGAQVACGTKEELAAASA